MLQVSNMIFKQHKIVSVAIILSKNAFNVYVLLLIAERSQKDFAIPSDLHVYMYTPEERLNQYNSDIKVRQFIFVL